MLVALASAVLALASPLVGHRLENRIDREEPAHLTGPTVLNPRTLKPAENAPRLPRSATNVEISPDGDRLVAVHGDDLLFASLRSGKRLGSLEIGVDEHATLSWLEDDRLLVLDCSQPNPDVDCVSSRVRAVDPIAREPLGDPLELPGEYRTSRAGRRQLVVLDDWFVSDDLRYPPTQYAPPDRMSPAGLVLDSDGQVEHVLDLAGWDLVDLDRTLLYGVDRDTQEGIAGRVDLRRGRITVRYRTQHGPPQVMVPSLRDRAVINGRVFNRWTLERVGRSRVTGQYDYDVHAAGDGYVRDVWPSGTPDTSQLRYSPAPGTRGWSRFVPEMHLEEVIGRYLYVQQVEDHSRSPGRPWTARFHVDVYRLRDGRHVRRVPGRFTLTAPDAGHSAPQVPLLNSERGALNRADDEEYCC